MRRRSTWLSFTLLGFLAPVAAAAQDHCTPIRFAKGASKAVVHGVAPPDDQMTCYSFVAAAAQTAMLKVTGPDMVISVIDVGDDQPSWTFKTKAGVNTFVVGPQNRIARPSAFTVTLSIK